MPLPSRRAAMLLSMPVAILAMAAPYATFRWMVPKDPLAANMTQLGRWLVLYDVEEQPLDVQNALVDRVQDQLGDIDLSSSEGVQLSQKQQDRLNQNVSRLQRVWFERRCAQASQKHSNADRVSFLRAQVETLLKLAELADALPRQDGESGDGDALAAFLANVSVWQDEADPELREQMTDGIRDGLLVYMGFFDLGDLSADERETLANRVAETLDQRGASSSVPVHLTGEPSRVMAANSELLMEAWFRSQADVYANVPQENRKAHIAELLQRVEAWNLPKLLGGQATTKAPDEQPSDASEDKSEGNSPGSGELQYMLHLRQQSKVWIERADEPDQTKMKRLAAAIQHHFWWKGMKSLLQRAAPPTLNQMPGGRWSPEVEGG